MKYTTTLALIGLLVSTPALARITENWEHRKGNEPETSKYSEDAKHKDKKHKDKRKHTEINGIYI